MYDERKSLSELMEEEEMLQCDIDLYSEQILRLQLNLQAKKITYQDYTASFETINNRINVLRDKLNDISYAINSIIVDDYSSGSADIYDIEDNDDVYGFIDYLDFLDRGDSDYD